MSCVIEPVLGTGVPAARGVRLCVTATADITIQNLCRGRLEYLSAHGFDVTVVCGPTAQAEHIRARGVKLFTADLTRRMSPLRDLRALWQLFRFFQRERFDIIEVSTPKAALVGAVAARLAGRSTGGLVGDFGGDVPRRSGQAVVVHLLRGLAYQGQGFAAARLMRWAQRVPSRLADNVVVVSGSLRARAVADKVVKGERAVVLGAGSSNGVDVERFHPSLRAEREALHGELGIAPHAVVAGFVGRMTQDKGIAELMPAFEAARVRYPNLWLLIVGDYEPRDRPVQEVIDRIEHHPQVVRTGWQEETARYYGAMDFLVLPSRREGFANVLLEAQAAGLAVVATDIEGCRDAVQSGVTGLLVPPGSASALGEAIEQLAGNADQRRRMGEAGREWVVERFEQGKIWALYRQHYLRMLRWAE